MSSRVMQRTACSKNPSSRMFQVALLMIGLVAVYGQKGSDGFTDEDRPYEFGFNIEGYQHRHEKKGKQSNRICETIIMKRLS